MKVTKILDLHPECVIGVGDMTQIRKVKPLSTAHAPDLTFIKNESIACETKASVVVVPTNYDLDRIPEGKTVILSPDPKLTVAKIMHHMGYEKPQEIIREGYTLIGSVHLGEGVEIGRGTVIGCAGQGWVKDGNSWIEFPQMGGVYIGDNTKIGCGSYICRGTFRNTVLGHGNVLGHHVGIGHNCNIGNHNMILNKSILMGSVTMGSNNYIAPGVSITNQSTVGNDQFIKTHAIFNKR